ncbi:MAG: hypothetical protein KC442_21070 [Thermomicrobiales bacterium]|nr:hypothetical protein [Thermomicrobiales bacterium]
MPPELLVIGVPLVIVVPALVELAKRMGLPSIWAGLASILSCALVLGLVQLQVHPLVGGAASWALASIIYGLAAAGLYSQVDKLSRG